MNIDIVSDVVCPWCYVGKRQIEQALAQHARENPDAAPPRVTWKPFELNPDMPPEGMSRQDYVTRKFGAARSKDVYARVTGVGAQHGIAFAFDRIVRQPNTLAAHSLIALAGEQPEAGALQDRVVEALFKAYFLDARDLTDRDTLVEIATSAGLDRSAAERRHDDPSARQTVAREEHDARALGVEGVPFFILDRRLAVSGAQGADALLAAIRQLESATA